MITWIASYPKSGSTWLRLLLSAYILGECDLNTLSSTTGDLRPHNYQNVTAKPVGALSRAEVACLRPAALMQIIATWPIRPIMVKTHFVNSTVDDIPSIPAKMTSRAFYVVRDPRDVALSYAHHFNVDVDAAIEAMADPGHTIGDPEDKLEHIISSWSEHVTSWLLKKPYPVHLVRYEALHERPTDVLGNVVAALGLEPDPDRMARAVDAVCFERLQAQEAKDGFSEAVTGRQFFRKGKVGEWREALTAAQAQRITDAHDDIMVQMGYV